MIGWNERRACETSGGRRGVAWSGIRLLLSMVLMLSLTVQWLASHAQEPEEQEGQAVQAVPEVAEQAVPEVAEQAVPEVAEHAVPVPPDQPGPVTPDQQPDLAEIYRTGGIVGLLLVLAVLVVKALRSPVLGSLLDVLPERARPWVASVLAGSGVFAVLHSQLGGMGEASPLIPAAVGALIVGPGAVGLHQLVARSLLGRPGPNTTELLEQLARYKEQEAKRAENGRDGEPGGKAQI